MKIIIVLFFIIFSISAYSQKVVDKLSLNLNITSHHLSYNKEYNTQNLGGGIEWKWLYDTTKTQNFWRSTRLNIGYYTNSYYHPTFYCGIASPIYRYKKFETGITLGGGSGYRGKFEVVGYEGGDFMPFGFLYVEYDFKYFRPRIHISPIVVGFQINIGKK